MAFRLAAVERPARMFVQMLVLGLIGGGVLMVGAGARADGEPRRQPIKMVVLGDSLSAGSAFRPPAHSPRAAKKP